MIVKPLVVIVGDRADYESLKPTAAYVPHRRKQRDPVKDVTEGDPPPALTSVKWTVRLPAYDCPIPLKAALDMPRMADKTRRLRSSFLPEKLTSGTHAPFFHAMLYIEEHQSA